MPDSIPPRNLMTPANQTNSPPASQAWQPSPGTPLWASIVVGTLGACAPAALTMIPPPWGPVLAILLGGVASGIGMFYGLKSGGAASPKP